MKTISKKPLSIWVPLAFAAGFPILIFGCVMVVYFLLPGSEKITSGLERANTRSTPAGSFDQSIAVLPLVNMSPDSENALFAENVHEKILSNLSRIQNLNTINRTSMFAYKNSSKSHTTIAQELGVRYIVEGSARRSEDQIRITIQLIEAQTEKHIWAEQYTRDSKNQFDLEAEIAQEIAQQLNRAMAMN
ncbi:MAG: adenylate cyclase [Candidatus Pelagisphaera sp.]|jgi:adenylate cyclase